MIIQMKAIEQKFPEVLSFNVDEGGSNFRAWLNRAVLMISESIFTQHCMVAYGSKFVQ